MSSPPKKSRFSDEENKNPKRNDATPTQTPTPSRSRSPTASASWTSSRNRSPCEEKRAGDCQECMIENNHPSKSNYTSFTSTSVSTKSRTRSPPCCRKTQNVNYKVRNKSETNPPDNPDYKVIENKKSENTIGDMKRDDDSSAPACKGCGKSKKARTPTPIFNKDEGKEEEFNEVRGRCLQKFDPELVSKIEAEILEESALCPRTKLDDIVGLGLAKEVIKEVVVYPLRRPELFTGLRRPPKGILLFGPPGTGKTLIGRCIATETDSTFFNITSSSLTSKWMGESEKLVRALFLIAKSREPSVIFVDEIDALLSQRSIHETGSSRRMKNEFLINMDGACTTDDDKIIIIGATNRPQELDEAARRRFVKRLYIPLPDEKGRKELLTKLLEKERHSLTCEDIMCVAKNTRGYSGADIKNLCHEAAMGPIRCIPLTELPLVAAENVRPINISDFKRATVRIKPSVSKNDLSAYEIWDKTYGCSCTT